MLLTSLRISAKWANAVDGIDIMTRFAVYALTPVWFLTFLDRMVRRG
jgi:hypothetical protein